MNCYKTKYKVTTRIQDDQYDLISKYLFIKINVFYEMSQYILYISSFWGLSKIKKQSRIWKSSIQIIKLFNKKKSSIIPFFEKIKTIIFE